MSQSAALQPGARFGNYQVERLLGKGAMGAVYLAKDTVLGRSVVVKVILGDSANDPALLERFRREAQAGARIDSENVVKVYDAGRAFNAPYIVMQHVDGQSIDEVLAMNGPLRPDVAAALTLGIARGLAAAHAAGIVHRDVKPSNALLCRDGRVKLSDFGIAKFLTGLDGGPPPPDITKPGALVGTPAYMAPEQALSQPVDGRADVYALGCAFYQLLTRRVPFEAPTFMELLGLRLDTDPRPPRELVPAIPPAVESACLAFLEKDAAKRPNARAAVGLLEKLVTTDSLDALPKLFADPNTATQVGSDPVTRAGQLYGLDKAPTPLSRTVAEHDANAAARATTKVLPAPAAATTLLSPSAPTLPPPPAPSQAPRRVDMALFALGSLALAVAGLAFAFGAFRGAPPPPPAASFEVSAARKALLAAMASRDPARVLAARDALRAQPGADEALLAAAGDGASLLAAFDASAKGLGLENRTAPLDDVFKALLDAVERKPGTRIDRDVRAAATLLAAVEGRTIDSELFLPREATGEAADKLRRAVNALGLAYPTPR